MKKESKTKQPNIHPKIYQFVNRDWDITVSKTVHQKTNPNQKNGIDPQLFRCAVCLSQNIKYIHGWGFGSMAGGAEWNEFQCLQCLNYTFFEKEWG